MKFFRKIVDERQEHEMMKVERGGFWLMCFALPVVMLVQIFVFNVDMSHLAGSYIVLFIGAIWLAVGYYRKGLWDYFFNPGIKYYIIASVLAGSLSFILISLLHYFRSGLSLVDSLRASIAWSLIPFAMTFLILAIQGTLTKRRRIKLQQKYKDDM